MPTPYAGPERRYLDRTVARRRVVGYARISSDRRSRSVLPGEWYPVLDRRPGAQLALEDGLPRPGFVWVEVSGKAQEAWAAFLDIEHGP
jgi:hypothetical protein